MGQRVAAGITLLALLAPAGCSIGDIRRPPPPASVAPSATPESTRPAPVPPAEVRRVRVPVPGDYQQQNVEFTDQVHGYALFTRCGQAGDGTGKTVPSCQAILLATADGGRSWQKLRHPRPEARNQQLYAGGDGLVLLAEPHGWYASPDRGRTFRHLPIGREAPPAYLRLFGRFQICCDADPQPRIVEWTGERRRPLPVQPDVGNLHSVGYGGGSLMAAGLRDGQPYTAIGSPDGRTWQPIRVHPADRPVAGVRVELSPSGSAWLVGRTDDPQGFPPLWHLVTGAWEFEPAVGHPAVAHGFAVTLAGMLAVSGPDGPGLVTGGRFYPKGWPIAAGWLRSLDGTALLHTASEDGTVSIGLPTGTPAGVDYAWIRLVLEKS
ncbi:MAG TPA: hypothetical protein VGD43_02920 [Micromonospora sp.]